MSKRGLLCILFSLVFSFCFAEEFESIRIELITQKQEVKIIYDGNRNDNSYPFTTFSSCLNGWGRKGGLKKISPLFVKKELTSEGIYTIYVTTLEGKKISYRLMNFYNIQDLQTKTYYETNFLRYLYEFMAKKYLEEL